MGWGRIGLLGALLWAGAARATVLLVADTAAPLPAPKATVVAEQKPASPAAAKPAQSVADQLIYKDGDRVRGRFVKFDGGTIIFKSERFGLLNVPTADASVALANVPVVKPNASSDGVAAAREGEEQEEASAWPFSPLAIARSLQEFFGAWHGKFAVSAEVLNDTAEHNSETVQVQLGRKWEHDTLKLNGRYDFGATNHVTTTDLLTADASWRHEFPEHFFSVYQPKLEWNRNFYTSTTPALPADYVLLQQEAGVGVNLSTSKTRKLRTGVSENIFSVWTTPAATAAQDTHTAESVFLEGEMKLPWRISITDRGIYYYSIARDTEGWENRFEIDKKLTETLTVGMRHELRTNNPDVRVADYRRLKLLFGLEF